MKRQEKVNSRRAWFAAGPPRLIGMDVCEGDRHQVMKPDVDGKLSRTHWRGLEHIGVR